LLPGPLNGVIRRNGATALFITYPFLNRSVQLPPTNELLIKFDTHYGEVTSAVPGNKYGLIVGVAVLGNLNVSIAQIRTRTYHRHDILLISERYDVAERGDNLHIVVTGGRIVFARWLVSE
jgi:hypothetical protein